MFPIDGPPSDGGAVDEVCAGLHTTSPLLTGCGQSQRPELAPRSNIDTDADCDIVLPQTDLDATPLCVIGASNIMIGSTTVVGSRGLLLVAVHELRVVGQLSVASRRDQLAGAGANFPRCAGMLAGSSANAASGGGGGAGGGFGGGGGDGGKGVGGPAGGMAIPEPPLSLVRGGCPGGDGGENVLNPSEALGGASGGAMYLLAGDAIVIDGLLDASGTGGSAGTTGIAGTAGGGGGGGGGSGGLIALDAPTITLGGNSRLIANGGGGGGGGPTTTAASAGGDPMLDAPPFLAVGGISPCAAKGGNGATAVTAAATGAQGTAGGCGGGGGGGGVGLIVAFGSLVDDGADASPAIQQK